MFVRRKTIKGRVYYYLVRSMREGCRVKQEFVEYLGPEQPSRRRVNELKRKHERNLKT
jgi:hypothetical protein